MTIRINEVLKSVKPKIALEFDESKALFYKEGSFFTSLSIAIPKSR